MTKIETTVAIHQPNFLPWLGFFDKIVRSDIFVILDHVTNRPNDAIWTKRVQILCNKAPFWLVAPLKKPKAIEFVPINQMRIDNESNFTKKHLKTFNLNYGKLPYYQEILPLLEDFYNYKTDLIAEKNLFFISNVCNVLEINTKFIKSSELNCHASSTELLVEICEKVNANAYIYGGGANNYQENQTFEERNIKPIPQNFIYPEYSQLNSKNFISGLSIIDALMNLGIKGTKKLLQN